MLLTFSPPIAPSPGTSSKPELRLLKVEFGDGYTQATRDGLNHRRRVESLVWEVLTATQAKAITDFLEARGGDQPFLYTPTCETSALKWTCDDWQSEHLGAGLMTVRATLRQSFSLQS